MARIYIVEDNENLREAVVSYLTLYDHEVAEFGALAGLEEAVRSRMPDLMILDVMLPDGDGFHMARRLRKNYTFPIVFLTARVSETDRITGFEVGGDDYVTKPFSPKELSMRVQAILKRTGASSVSTGLKGSWTLGGMTIEIDPASHTVTADGRDANLTAAEWKILVYLSTHPGIVVARERLLGESLDYMYTEGSERTVDTHIKNIRGKLGNPGWIETVRGFGYRFAGEPA